MGWRENVIAGGPKNCQHGCCSNPCRCPDYLVDSALSFTKWLSSHALQQATGLDAVAIKRELNKLLKTGAVEKQGNTYRIST